MQMLGIGRSDLSTAPLVFGGNVLGWTLPKPDAFRVLDAFVERGFTMIDTADVYSAWSDAGIGASERIIGEWLHGAGSAKRERVIVATKVGAPMGKGLRGLSSAYIATAAEASLARLRTDRIDLYQAHEDDPRVPLEETMRAFGGLVAAGKVRVLGASNYSAVRLREALDVAEGIGGPRFESFQPHFNLIERDGFERELQPLCIEREIGVIPFFSLASGFLTGKYRNEADLRGNGRAELAAHYATPHGFRVLEALRAVADGRGVAPAQIALAWSMAQPGITAPIASATTLAQLEELAGAAEIELTADELTALAVPPPAEAVHD